MLLVVAVLLVLRHGKGCESDRDGGRHCKRSMPVRVLRERGRRRATAVYGEMHACSSSTLLSRRVGADLCLGFGGEMEVAPQHGWLPVPPPPLRLC